MSEQHGRESSDNKKRVGSISWCHGHAVHGTTELSVLLCRATSCRPTASFHLCAAPVIPCIFCGDIVGLPRELITLWGCEIRLDQPFPTRLRDVLLLETSAEGVDTLDPKTRQFSDFPAWVDDNADRLR